MSINLLAANAVNPSDRRRSRRFSCHFDIAIEWGAAQLPGTVSEISAEGMFVELEAPLWIGARFAARLALDLPVDLDCVACRVEPRRGMGITFSTSHASGEAAISSLLERLATL